jgi:type IV pilus assembly protein PilC
VIRNINEGYSPSEAVAGLLPPLAVGSLRAAESAGSMEETLDQIAKYYESKADLDEKVISAMAYPVFVLLLSLMTVIALIVFVMPGMKGMFEDIGGQLPPITSVLIRGSELLYEFWYAILAFFIISTLVFSRYFKRCPDKVENIIMRVPLMKEFIKKEIIIHGAGTLGMLLKCGIPISEALAITARASRSPCFNQIVLRAKEAIENGGKLSAHFSESGVFSEEMVRMLKVGESSGRLAEMLINISDFQAKEREYFLSRFTVLIEPVMTLGVGLIVGFVVMAVFLPLINMISSLK